jgi:hypothetical protein
VVDNSISWLAAIGNAAAPTFFDELGPGTTKTTSSGS